MARRVTTHNARKGKDGVFNPNHNDRMFDSAAEHINKEKSKNNLYWRMQGASKLTFEEAEQKFYNEHFQDGLDKINAKHEKSRHTDRMKTMDEYRKSEKTCPEETLFYIGDRTQPIDRKTFKAIINEQIAWEAKTFPQVATLDVALHVDEEDENHVPSADHVHKRSVWIAHDENGNLIVNQNKALKEMGIERPDPSKPENRFNNAKITYTKMVRQHFIDLCKSYGIEIIEEPREKSKSGLSMEKYKSQQITKELEEKSKQISEQQQNLEDQKKQISEDFKIKKSKLDSQAKSQAERQTEQDAREEQLKKQSLQNDQSQQSLMTQISQFLKTIGDDQKEEFSTVEDLTKHAEDVLSEKSKQLKEREEIVTYKENRASFRDNELKAQMEKLGEMFEWNEEEKQTWDDTDVMAKWNMVVKKADQYVEASVKAFTDGIDFMKEAQEYYFKEREWAGAEYMKHIKESRQRGTAMIENAQQRQNEIKNGVQRIRKQTEEDPDDLTPQDGEELESSL